MSDDIDYGRLSKRIVFTDNDHRHAKLTVRLKHDNLKQSEFFRHVITGYIDGDERIIAFVDDIKKQSIKHKTQSRKLRQKGKNTQQDLGFSENDIEDLFDIIEEGHPDL
jgi:hypothetical protein